LVYCAKKNLATLIPDVKEERIRESGLPDGFFSNQKSKFGQILESLGILYGHLGYFMTIWCLLCSFGTFFPGFGIMNRKNLATLPRIEMKCKIDLLNMRNLSGCQALATETCLFLSLFMYVCICWKQFFELSCTQTKKQKGDQIGRIFAVWAIPRLGAFLPFGHQIDRILSFQRQMERIFTIWATFYHYQKI
jgi:hypothetical protein